MKYVCVQCGQSKFKMQGEGVEDDFELKDNSKLRDVSQLNMKKHFVLV